MSGPAPRIRNRAKLREYAKRHYEGNRDAMIARARAHTVAAREKVREWILGYLLSHPCVDCGEADPIVLEFDHRADKAFEIGAAVRKGIGLKRLAAEVAKCDVRCANCHRRKTYRERGLSHKGKATDAERKLPPIPGSRIRCADRAGSWE